MKVIFMATPEFGVPILKSLNESSHEVIAVVCQPDRKGNRGKMTKPPVKVCAEEFSIPVLQYNKISKEGIEELKALNADIMVTAAFGQILTQEVLDICKYGVINVHASLLPKYRGSAPIHYAIINGESETGITIMQTERSLDTGDILVVESIKIEDADNTAVLTEKLSVLGSKLIVEALDKIEKGEITPIKQDNEIATYFPMLKKQDGQINFDKTSKEIFNFVRGMYPWPCAYTSYEGLTIKVLETKMSDLTSDLKAGQIVVADRKKGLFVKTADSVIELVKIQPQGKKAMFAKDYLLGKSMEAGSNLV